LFIARDSPEAADRVLKAVVKKFQLLGSLPELGRARDELASSLRSFPEGNYIIFYRPFPAGIEIVRVLHGARDLPPLFD
jgi:toxin ParE1/3/4